MKLQQYQKREALGNIRELSFFEANFSDFTSNFYLGKNALNQNTSSKSIGAGGSRLLIDNNPYHQFETWIAELLNFETALVFQSGYQANLSLFSIFEKDTLIVHDEYIHASIRDGIRLSTARRKSFEHNNLVSLNALLEENHSRFNAVVIVVESIYSMDGDIAPLSQIIELLDRFPNAKLIVDEAHSFGVKGKHGLGMTEELNSSDKIWANIVTFSKAIGYQGAAILMNHELKNWIVNLSRPFIYTTASSPNDLEIIRTRIQHLLDNPSVLEGLQKNIAFYQQQVSSPKFSKNDTAIQYFLGDTTKLKRLTKKATENQILIRSVSYPTVPEGKERIRLCLRADHSIEEIQKLIEILAD